MLLDVPERAQPGIGVEEKGHSVSHQVLADLAYELERSLQANSVTREGASHPDRNVQFEHLNNKAKELVGDFKNSAREKADSG